MVEGADIEAALAVVARQVYEPAPEVAVVGEVEDWEGDAELLGSLEEAISETSPDVEYLWLLHADARPRPDALAALVAETERNQAALAGSKLLRAGTQDELESVGGATDVFGEPYSGLDEGEIDLQQYDVVREVAFVGSASMLVRRDLAQGLGALDPLLPPVAAGLDFSQRARLAGGRVITVPSSEVYHQGRCGERGTGWREQAGRLRAMLIAYRPLTLLWVVPYDVLVSLLDSVLSLLMLRWKPLVRHTYSWLWNLLHLPSTLRQRMKLRKVRSEGDEELFRFHARGSLRLRAIGEELSGRFLGLFDEDQALSRESRRIWRAPGIWGALAAIAVVGFGLRSVFFSGMPSSGFNFPWESPGIALSRWFGGWNDTGLGSSAPVHPSVGLLALLSAAWFAAEGAARVVATFGMGILGIIGMGRLGGRLGLHGPGRYLAGLVLIGGPGTALLAGRGSWLSLAAAAAIPWLARSAYAQTDSGPRRWWAVGSILFIAVIVGSLSPMLVLVPALLWIVGWVTRSRRGDWRLALISILGGVAAAAFLATDPGWLVDGARRLGLDVHFAWPVIVLVACAPQLLGEGSRRDVAMVGGVLSLGATVASRPGWLGPGAEEALLVSASLGAALVVSAALEPATRRLVDLAALAAGTAAVLLSIVSITNGNLGLPGGDLNEELAFAETLAEDGSPGRVLIASTDPSMLPGEPSSGPGFFFRLVDGSGMTADEIWLPPERSGDESLLAALTDIATGMELRPGAVLADYAVEWVVLAGEPFRLDQALAAQLDLEPVPLASEARVFQNSQSSPLASAPSEVWAREGTGFSGDPTEERVRLAVAFDSSWSPAAERAEWATTVDGSGGSARYVPGGPGQLGAVGTLVLLGFGLAAMIFGRPRP